jgi:PAS domain-containing protein
MNAPGAPKFESLPAKGLSMQKNSGELQELLNVTALMAEPVIACDRCGQVVFANRAARGLFGDIDTEQNSIDDCPETLGIFDCQGERLLEPEEMPLAQAAFEGKVVQVNLMLRQEKTASPVQATAFPVLDRQGRQIGAMMVCRCLATVQELRRSCQAA